MPFIQQPGIFYNPPQPVQRGPYVIPPGAANPPGRQPDIQAIGLWSQPRWDAQRGPLNAQFSVVFTPTRAPSQAAIPLWLIPSWGAQSAGINGWQPAQPTPPVPVTLGLSAAYQWNTPTWGTQTLPTYPVILPVPRWFSAPLGYAVIGIWPQITWGAIRLPTPVLPFSGSPVQPWAPAASNYDVLGSWPQPSWGSQTLNKVLPTTLVVAVPEPWPVRWPMPPLSQAQLKKFIEQNRRAEKRRAKQIAAQVQYERELRQTIERAVYGEEPAEEIVEQAQAVVPPPLVKIDWPQVRLLVSGLLEHKPPDLRDLAQRIASEVIGQIPKPPKQMALQPLPDAEEGEIGEIHQIHSLYAQDLYERIDSLRRFLRGKFN